MADTLASTRKRERTATTPLASPYPAACARRREARAECGESRQPASGGRCDHSGGQGNRRQPQGPSNERASGALRLGGAAAGVELGVTGGDAHGTADASRSPSGASLRAGGRSSRLRGLPAPRFTKVWLAEVDASAPC